MDKSNIQNILADLIYDLFAVRKIDKDIIPYVDLIDDLGMDSITFISIIIDIEDKFNIVIPDEKLLLEEFRTFDNVLNIVSELLNEVECDCDGNAKTGDKND